MMILVLDTETTGLPDRLKFNDFYDYSFSRYYSGSRVIELACVLYNNEGNILQKHSWLISSEGVEIPPFITGLTGITQEMVKESGVSLDTVVPVFKELLDQASVLVMHNAKFDRYVLAAELYRTGYHELALEFFNKPYACTMEMGKQYTAIKTRSGFLKYPKLQELYMHFFHEPFESSHRALADVLATGQCYLRMMPLIPQKEEEVNQVSQSL